MQISAILSDYDGTLSPTTFFNHNNIKNEVFPNNNYSKTLELEKVLWEISSKISIGIITTKDFNFLHYRTRFANVLSCIMRALTIRKSLLDTNPFCIQARFKVNILRMRVRL